MVKSKDKLSVGSRVRVTCSDYNGKEGWIDSKTCKEDPRHVMVELESGVTEPFLPEELELI